MCNTRHTCPNCCSHSRAPGPLLRRTSQIWVMRSTNYVSWVLSRVIVTKMTRYYDAYLGFFTDYLQSYSPIEPLERFVFSPAYNFRFDLAAADGRDSKEEVQPQILNCPLAGLVRPFIHLASGLEFGVLGQVVEGAWPSLPLILFFFKSLIRSFPDPQTRSTPRPGRGHSALD